MAAITLTKYTATDFSTFYGLVKEDKLMRYISGKGLSEEEALKKFDFILKTNAENDAIGFFKIHSSTGEFMGDGKLEWNKRDKTKLEIGYILIESFWGKGFGTQICTKLLALAEEKFPAVDVIGIIDPENMASRKLLEKFGFKSYFIGIEDDLPTEKLILLRN